MPKKITLEEVIADFREVHGDRYDYSKVEYVSAKTKVTIICPEHGEFTQTPDKHKRGRGCPECGRSVRLTTQQVIKDFQKVHGDRYNYSKVDYVNMHTKVSIICQEHGEFWQTPSNHKNSQHCPECSSIAGAKKRSLTTQQVIKDFQKVHGDRYDYSKVEYVKNDTKVTIICLEHGEFWQTAHSHKSGRGCPKCGLIASADKQSLTTQQVIKDFCKVHGDRYDYSKVEYVNCETKVLIICPEHGEFWQTAHSHKSGTDCPECGNISRAQTRTLTTQQVIKDFQKVHGDRYDYSKVEYVSAKTKVTIICPEHGEFTQRPSNHKSGKGCNRCNGGKQLTQKEIIEDFCKVHGDRYDYSKVQYVNAKTKVLIICPEHGEFWQTTDSHKSGCGCPKCGLIASADKQSLTTQQVIKDFCKVHGDRYDYSKVEYVNCETKVLIICPEHGEFTQRPSNHKKGEGCPECGKNQISEPLFRECLESFISRFGKFEFPNTRPDWLRNPETGCKLELDCYNEELGLAFELQGGQHYKPIKGWGGEKAFARIIRRDVHKRTECMKHGVELFRIDNRPVKGKRPDKKKKYYEKQIRKCLNKAPEDVKLKLLNANKKEKA